MDKREKVIKGVECCAEGMCEECPYEDKCFSEEISICSPMAKDALELLKAQEPRVMTLEELNECVTYWVEDETGHVVPETIMDITGKDIMTIPVVHLTNGYAPIITKTTDGYNSKRFTGWRCWTSRPTDEQRAATPWEAVKP